MQLDVWYVCVFANKWWSEQQTSSYIQGRKIIIDLFENLGCKICINHSYCLPNMRNILLTNVHIKTIDPFFDCYQ